MSLNVTDANDAVPVVAPGQSLVYAENQIANALIGAVAATDDVGVTGFRFAGLDITTDAILSRAVEKLGSAELDASFEGESGSNILFRLGQVDMTRLSVPVHIPIVLGRHFDDWDPTRLDISPGVLCQDTAAASSALDCGYQIGFKFRLAPSIRSLIRAEGRAEAVDGYLLNSVTVGFQRWFGPSDQLAAGVDLSRQDRPGQADIRVMVRVGLGR